MRDRFETLIDDLPGRLHGGEDYLATFYAERSDFVRFNHGRIRQAGRVEQAELHLDLIREDRHAGADLTLSGDPVTDRQALGTVVAGLRDLLDRIPADPYLRYNREPLHSDHAPADPLPPAGAMVDDIVAAGGDRDLVGILASGGQYHGLASSFGQREWFASHSFNFDWSLYLLGDKAIKSRYAGTDWQSTALHERMQQATARLALMDRPVRRLEPGTYRALLAPAALAEITDLLGWGGFGLRAHRSGASPLARLARGECRLHPAVTLTEAIADGLAPPFQNQGFRRPPRLVLIERGEWRNPLISPRSAAEYGLSDNGAGDDEAPLALDLAPGGLPTGQALTALDTGLYIGNLWYLNYSDRNAGRLTGLTRFGTFWVEGGDIVAPAEVMRFDETLYNLLGVRLEALTREREWLHDPGSYQRRAQRSSRLPGLLVGGLRFTL